MRMMSPNAMSSHPKDSTERAARVCPSALKSRRNISLRDGGMCNDSWTQRRSQSPSANRFCSWHVSIVPRTANSFQLGHNTLFEAAFAVPRMSIVVSYERQPPRRPTKASTAQNNPKLEMPQDMKHYEALLASTQALGNAPPQTAKLTAAP